MSANTAAASANEAPKKGGKTFVIVAALVVLLLAGGGAAAWLLLLKKPQADEHAAARPEAPAHRAAPTYLAVENMVVNLADPGGERFAQVGITLELENDKAVDQIKAFMPAIRSRILLLLSQRTSEELLKRDGKEKLATDVMAESARVLGYKVDTREGKKKRDDEEEEEASPRNRKSVPGPVVGVFFSSFIVQ